MMDDTAAERDEALVIWPKDGRVSADRERASRFLSLVLRHRPELIGLELDAQGWAEVEDVVAKSARANRPLSRALIEALVRTSDKQRFALSPDGRKIRANQGHSVAVDLALPPGMPPERLYHGTATRFVEAIRREGLLPRSRRLVHLSADVETARTVGARHGEPQVLEVDAGTMHRAGHMFMRAANGVWLVERVPPEYLKP